MTPLIPVRLLAKYDRIELPDGRIADVIWVHRRQPGEFMIVDYADVTPIQSVQVCYLDTDGKYDQLDVGPDFEVVLIRSAAKTLETAS
jgi:hypothetical protein